MTQIQKHLNLLCNLSPAQNTSLHISYLVEPKELRGKVVSAECPSALTSLL